MISSRCWLVPRFPGYLVHQMRHILVDCSNWWMGKNHVWYHTKFKGLERSLGFHCSLRVRHPFFFIKLTNFVVTRLDDGKNDCSSNPGCFGRRVLAILIGMIFVCPGSITPPTPPPVGNPNTDSKSKTLFIIHDYFRFVYEKEESHWNAPFETVRLKRSPDR